MQAYLEPDAIARVDRLQPIADELGVSMAQLALAWCLRRSGVASAIIGATRIRQVEENAKTSEIEIPPELVARIDALFPAH